MPEHWNVTRLKTRVANVVDITRESNRDDIYLALEHVESWTGKYTVGGGVRFDSQAKRFRAEDVLFGKLRPYLAKVTRPNQSGVCVSELLVLRPRVADLSSRYLEQLLRSKQVIDAVDASTFGAKMPRADWQFIGDMRISLPPLAEQRAIARYLDYVDGRIERYIRAKERLIGLLEEQKRAVINQAVTRGLDPDVPLKPSGVEWLGDVPAHWEVRRLRTLANIATGGKDTVDRQDDGRYPFFVRSQTVEKIDSWSFDGEAVLTAGDGVGVGRVFHYVDGKFDFHQRVYKFSDFRDVYGRFFFHFLSAMFRFVVSQGTAKSTVDSLRLPMLQNFPVVLPKSTEQVAIVRHLDEHMMLSEKALSQTRKQIELIKEFRTRLIADVVTGKLDVRDAVAGLADDGVGVVDYPGTEA